MVSVRKSSSLADGRKVCSKCGEAKSALEYASTEESVCLACVDESREAEERRRVEEQRLADAGRMSAPLASEVDYENPSTQELAARTLARRNLLHFIKRFRPMYMAGWVHTDICRRLVRFMEDVQAKKSPRLLLMCPPRSGKSEIGSRHFAPFVMGHNPQWEIIAASHTGSLALSFSRYIRDVIRDPSYTALFPKAVLDPNSQSVENWNMTAGGGYLAAGVGSGITGRGCFTCNTVLHNHTRSDILPIHAVKVGEYVYGYDHNTHEVRPVRVIAVSLSRTQRELYAVEDIRCTDDHEFCTSVADEGRYTRASALATDMPLVRRTEVQSVEDVPCVLLPGTADALDRPGVSEVRGEESRPSVSVQALPHRRIAWGTEGGVGVRQLPEGVREEAARARGGEKEVRGAKNVLFARVLRSVSEGARKAARYLHGLWGAAYSSRPEKILLSHVLPEESPERYEGVHRELLHTQEVVAVAERPGLCDVWAEDLPGRGASHRPRPGEQRSSELGAVVLSLSQVVSHTEGVSAGELEAWVQARDGELVVDLQTEAGNFFCGRVQLLAHNCHILLIDDLVRDIEAADSQLQRDNIWNWYVTTAYTRLAPGGGVLAIMTTWHEDDFAGRIQQLMASGEGDVFEIVKYPAINESGDEYLLANDSIVQLPPGSEIPDGARMTRRKDTALHPERYDTEAMLRVKRNFYAAGQKRMWASLYQQDPTPSDGAYFTRQMFRYYASPPHALQVTVYQAWDWAISEKAQSDYTVGVTVAQDPQDNLYLLDVYRFKMGDGQELMQRVVSYAQQWSPLLIGFEDGQIFKSLQSTFTKTCAERGYYPSYEVLSTLTDKMVRAQPLRGRLQVGKLWLPQEAPWVEDLKTEFLRFPAGKHDDQVDACAHAVRLTMSRSAPRLPEPKKLPSWKDRFRSSARHRGTTHMAA